MLLSRPPTPGSVQVPLYHLRHEPAAIFDDIGARATCARRRRLLAGAAGAAGLLIVGGCGRDGGAAVAPTSDAVRRAEATRQAAGGRLVTARLTPRPVTLDLGGPTVRTWAYGDNLPGPLLRARAGDRLRVDLINQLPVDTTVHWHGVALRNDMDGVPGITQDAIAAGTTFRYEFTVPHRARTSTTHTSACSSTAACTA